MFNFLLKAGHDFNRLHVGWLMNDNQQKQIDYSLKAFKIIYTQIMKYETNFILFYN